MKTLAKGIYQLDLVKANVFLIEGKNGLVLVDAAVVGVKDKLASSLQKNGFSLADIKHILITHAHVDHVGGLKEIQEATGADVWAHPLEVPFIVRGEHTPYPDQAQVGLFDRGVGMLIASFVGAEQPGAPVHHEVKGGDLLDDIWEGLEIVHLPGHSPGQLGFWFSKERVLLGGDVAMHLLPWLHLPLGAYTPDMPEAKRSIIKAAALKPRALGVGHGAPLIGNAEAKLTQFTAKLQKTLTPARG